MRKRLAAGALALVMLLLLAGSAGAIVYGEPDDGRHPFVGALIAEWREPGVKEHLCSGTLISPTVFLTAAHCTAYLEGLGIPNDQIWVSFDEVVGDPVGPEVTLYRGTWHTHPGYGGAQDDPADVAVVVLDAPVTHLTPAQLPELGFLDTLAARGGLVGAKFTAVGYGVREPEFGGPEGYEFPYDGTRWMSVSEYLGLTDAWLFLSQNDATDDGGTCYGDSGGPNFLGAGDTETTIIAAITVTGDVLCVATNQVYRMDIPTVHDFVAPFLTQD